MSIAPCNRCLGDINADLGIDLSAYDLSAYGPEEWIPQAVAVYAARIAARNRVIAEGGPYLIPAEMAYPYEQWSAAVMLGNPLPDVSVSQTEFLQAAQLEYGPYPGIPPTVQDALNDERQYFKYYGYHTWDAALHNPAAMGWSEYVKKYHDDGMFKQFLISTALAFVGAAAGAYLSTANVAATSGAAAASGSAGGVAAAVAPGIETVVTTATALAPASTGAALATVAASQAASALAPSGSPSYAPPVETVVTTAAPITGASAAEIAANAAVLTAATLAPEMSAPLTTDIPAESMPDVQPVETVVTTATPIEAPSFSIVASAAAAPASQFLDYFEAQPTEEVVTEATTLQSPSATEVATDAAAIAATLIAQGSPLETVTTESSHLAPDNSTAEVAAGAAAATALVLAQSSAPLETVTTEAINLPPENEPIISPGLLFDAGAILATGLLQPDAPAVASGGSTESSPESTTPTSNDPNASWLDLLQKLGGDALKNFLNQLAKYYLGRSLTPGEQGRYDTYFQCLQRGGIQCVPPKLDDGSTLTPNGVVKNNDSMIYLVLALVFAAVILASKKRKKKGRRK